MKAYYEEVLEIYLQEGAALMGQKSEVWIASEKLYEVLYTMSAYRKGRKLWRVQQTR